MTKKSNRHSKIAFIPKKVINRDRAIYQSKMEGEKPKDTMSRMKVSPDIYYRSLKKQYIKDWWEAKNNPKKEESAVETSQSQSGNADPHSDAVDTSTGWTDESLSDQTRQRLNKAAKLMKQTDRLGNRISAERAAGIAGIAVPLLENWLAEMAGGGLGSV